MDAIGWIELVGGGLAIIVGLSTLVKGYLEYRRQGAVQRTEQFLMMRSRLRENKDFQRLIALLEKDEEALERIPLVVKDSFVGFYEELALLWNTGVFPDQVVDYMFGHFALKCWQSKHFWKGISDKRDDWVHFRDFVQRIEQLRRHGINATRDGYRL